MNEIDGETLPSANVWTALALSAAAGISTTLGGLLPFLISIENVAWLSVSLAFSAGVMIYVSFVEIFHEAEERFELAYSEEAAALYTTLGFFGGVALCAALDWIVHRIDPGHEHHETQNFNDIEKDLQRHHGQCSPASHMSMRAHRDAHLRELAGGTPDGRWQLAEDELHDPEAAPKAPREAGARADSPCLCREGYSGICAGPGDAQSLCAGGPDLAVHSALRPDRRRLARLSMVSALAIAFHNFPEGIATFISSLESPRLGATIALAIAIHNVPEGICVAIPAYYATGSRLKAVMWATLAGIAEPIGALIALAVLKNSTDGNFSPFAYGLMFSVVAGMMVFISLAELLPTAAMYDHRGTLVTKATLVGMAVMAGSLVMFSQLGMSG